MTLNKYVRRLADKLDRVKRRGQSRPRRNIEMNSIEVEIPANVRTLNRSVSLTMRNGMGEILTAKLTGNETTGADVTFRGDGVTSKGKVTAVNAYVTGSVWLTVASNLSPAP